jgi:hypothetical protein
MISMNTSSVDFLQEPTMVISYNSNENLQQVKVPTTNFLSIEFYFIFSFNMFEFD